MQAMTDYRWIRLGEWRLVVESGAWNSELQTRVMEAVGQQPWAKHPQTLALSFSSGERKLELFLKIFHASKGGAACKNWFRRSKALQAWSQGTALIEAGFNAPVIVAAGESRSFGKLARGFTLSQKVEGSGVPFYLRDLLAQGLTGEGLKAKRNGIQQLAALIRRFHDSGFVHGDLVATNIFVHRPNDDRMNFCFMDNDRTRRYPRWLPQNLWKRNLIQLNRLPLPGITLQDRMRFFCAYLDKSKLTAAERKLARWFERETRQRRKECDGVSATADFRKLMRWTGNLPATNNLEGTG